MKFPNNKIAHRGVFNNKDIPENSMKAFKKAVELNFAIELDIHLTKDNHLVVFHDDNLYRMTGVNKKISTINYSEIKDCYLLNTKEKIPTLLDVLKTINDKVCIVIEIKADRRYKEMISLLMKELEPFHNYVIQSFHPEVVRYIKCHYPNIEVGYIINKSNQFFHKILCSRLMINYSKADFLSIHKELLSTKKMINYKKKMPIFLWTIKKNDDYSNQDYVLICNDLI